MLVLVLRDTEPLHKFALIVSCSQWVMIYILQVMTCVLFACVCSGKIDDRLLTEVNLLMSKERLVCWSKVSIEYMYLMMEHLWIVML